MFGIGTPELVILFLVLLSVIFVFKWILSLVDILRNEFTDNNKIVWLLVVVFIPLFGVIAYHFIGTKQKTSRITQQLTNGRIILFSCLITAAIAGIATVIFLKSTEMHVNVGDSKTTDAKVMIVNIETALKLYKLDNGKYPTTEQGLSALVKKPTVGIIPKDYRADGYLDNKIVPKDPWGNEYIYESPGVHGDYDLVSYGADGGRGGSGINVDIESWNLR